MKNQKIVNLFNNTANQPSKFRIKNWVEISEDSRRTNNRNTKIKFKVLISKSSLCDKSNAYILGKGTITVSIAAVDPADANNDNKKVIFRNCAPFADFIS